MKEKNNLSLLCLECQSPLTVICSHAQSEQVRRHYLTCRKCKAKFFCIVYVKSFIQKGTDISPPDELLQPDLCRLRTKLLSSIYREPKSEVLEPPKMVFRN